jgi:hypothetical protein
MPNSHKETEPKESKEDQEEMQQKYIPVYKKGFRSKTYHSKTPETQSQFQPNIKSKTRNSKTQYHRKIIKHYDKVLVFDLDETLGSFSELQWIWNAMIHLHPRTKANEKSILKTLLDIYPEFLRPGILHILEYITQKKKKGECIAIFLYTNNQHPPPWTEIIVDYFNHYIEETTHLRPFFDQIIQAFKIGQEKVEWMRTSHDKSYDDFIKCSILPKQTEICFIDNTYFQSMVHPKVYYIQPKSYQHSLSSQDIVQRFILAETSGILDDYFPITIPSFPSASSFLFFSTAQISNSQKQARKSVIRNFIQQAMEEYVANCHSLKIKRLRTNNLQSTTICSITPLNPSQQHHHFETIQIDLYVSQKLMDFIREFFVLTTFSHMLTRKQKPGVLAPPPPSPAKITNIDSQIITSP